MSFVEGFYSFGVELTNSDVGLYESFRVKAARHPYESLHHLYARMLTYVHCYQVGQEFTEGLFNPKQPTIWRKDIIGDLLLWVQVDVPEQKKLKAALRNRENTEYRIYFFSKEQIDSFCWQLRGSKTNWIEGMNFFLIEPEFLEKLIPLTSSSSKWLVTIVDNSIYLTFNNQLLETYIETVDIWKEFQRVINNELQTPQDLH